MENYKIYVHINKINGKIYIGQTGQENVKDRWDSGWGYKQCVAFNNAINKYGWNNFQHIVLIDRLTLEMANIIEEELKSIKVQIANMDIIFVQVVKTLY